MAKDEKAQPVGSAKNPPNPALLDVPWEFLGAQLDTTWRQISSALEDGSTLGYLEVAILYYSTAMPRNTEGVVLPDKEFTVTKGDFRLGELPTPDADANLISQSLADLVRAKLDKLQASFVTIKKKKPEFARSSIRLKLIVNNETASQDGLDTPADQPAELGGSGGGTQPVTITFASGQCLIDSSCPSGTRFFINSTPQGCCS